MFALRLFKDADNRSTTTCQIGDIPSGAGTVNAADYVITSTVASSGYYNKQAIDRILSGSGLSSSYSAMSLSASYAHIASYAFATNDPTKMSVINPQYIGDLTAQGAGDSVTIVTGRMMTILV